MKIHFLLLILFWCFVFPCKKIEASLEKEFLTEFFSDKEATARIMSPKGLQANPSNKKLNTLQANNESPTHKLKFKRKKHRL